MRAFLVELSRFLFYNPISTSLRTSLIQNSTNLTPYPPLSSMPTKTDRWWRDGDVNRYQKLDIEYLLRNLARIFSSQISRAP
jgi:hypothetical protein